MRFKFGLVLSLIGLLVFATGVLTPTIIDPGLSAAGQRKGTLLLAGVVLTLSGLFLMVSDFGKRLEK